MLPAAMESYIKSRVAPTKLPAKAPTGIIGLDQLCGSGLPRGRTTLLLGGPGSGKTVLALQFLVHGAQYCKEPGIFVAFEETASRIVANAADFGWNLARLQPKKLFIIDAQPTADAIQLGDFDLIGLLAVLTARTKALGTRRIVLDALDVVLAGLPDAAAKRREIYRIHEWLLTNGLTAIITSKDNSDEHDVLGHQPFGFMQFMVDCAVILNHHVVQGVSQRSLRVLKYRGSSFQENESPFVISGTGLEVAGVRTLSSVDVNVTNERVSSGIERLDTMLGGGYYRAANVLITGFSGTAKTTLSGAFAEAACKRQERTLFVSFGSDGTEVIRNLASVGLRLHRYVKSGRLRIVSAPTLSSSAEHFLVQLKTLAKEHKARCLVIDPISSLIKGGNELTAHSVVERLLDWSKAEGITLVSTSLIDEVPTESALPLEISKIADTWIHLNYLVQAGERNRSLSIIKSRGMAHSNQVRELILSDTGVTLTDAYTAGGEVLMGTLRWEKERADGAEYEVSEVAGRLKRVRLDAEAAELEVRAKSLQVEVEAKQVEKALLARTTESRKGELSRGRTRLKELRGG
jgi:circadian clock protein KaiC